MLRKIRLLLGFGFVTGFVTLLCIFFTLSGVDKQSESRSLFDMSIEELMEIKVTVTVPQKESHASFQRKVGKVQDTKTTTM